MAERLIIIWVVTVLCVPQVPQPSVFAWRGTALEGTSASPCPWRPYPAASESPTASWLPTPPPCSPLTPHRPACSRSSTRCCLWVFSQSASMPMQVCGCVSKALRVPGFTLHLTQEHFPVPLEQKIEHQRDSCINRIMWVENRMIIINNLLTRTVKAIITPTLNIYCVLTHALFVSLILYVVFLETSDMSVTE